MRNQIGARGRGLTRTIDWPLVIIYLLLILIGWANIYSTAQATESSGLLDFGNRSGKQFFWILAAIGLACLILFVFNSRVYEGLALPIYIFAIGLLLAVIFLGVQVKGSRSWFEFGPIRFQPAEISKITTSLMLAAVMSQLGYKITRIKDFVITALIILVPMGIIIMQSETGSALVYVGLIFMLYREGLSGWFIVMIGLAILLFILTLTDSTFLALTVLLAIGSLCISLYSGRGRWWVLLGIPLLAGIAFLPEYMSIDSATNVVLGVFAIFLLVSAYLSFRERNRATQFSIIAIISGILLVFSVNYIFENVLQEHQRNRIEILLGMREDALNDGFNVDRSKTAIGSGGLTGAGYMQGTETQLKNVPEQSTDFIFCTIAEEWGFIGGSFVIILYVLLIWRIIHNAERSRESFTRIYGYCVASCIFMHLFVNIGMTLGIMPVIGIPLPLVSYGGSSLWAFTIMIFIFIALDRNERKYF